MGKMFLLEKGKYVVIRDKEKEVSFPSIEKFNFYNQGLVSLDLTGKNYIDYEPERRLYIDDSDDTIGPKDIPNSALESLIQSVDILLERTENPYYGVSLEDAYFLKRHEITMAREQVLSAPFLHSDGHRYDADQKARERILGTVLFILLGFPLPEDFVWMTADNVLVPHTAQSISQLFAAMMQWEKNILATSWHKKDVELIQLAETMQSVESIKNYNASAGF